MNNETPFTKEQMDADENATNNDVGLGILLATLLVAVVIVAVGITVPMVEAQAPVGWELVESDVKWIKREINYNWLPSMRDQAIKIQELEQDIRELEVTIKAKEKEWKTQP